jgi:hypothetical protein
VEFFPGGRIKIVNEPVKLLIRTAFQLQNAQIADGPDWLESAAPTSRQKQAFRRKSSPIKLAL